MFSEEDTPAQQEPLRTVLVEGFQATAEPPVRAEKEDIPDQQELSHPMLVEVFQASEPSVTANRSSGHLQGEETERIKISNILHRQLANLGMNTA